jgi:hypothetical protein
MIVYPQNIGFRAAFLTLLLPFLCSSCATLFHGRPNTCNSRAYTENHVGEYIRMRFPKGAPVRMGIIPFSAPANVSAQSLEFPGLGNTLAWKVRDEILSRGEIPIVEVLNRQDWPYKKEEFPLGNFEALRQARNADYDLVLIGNLEPFTNLNRMKVHYKIVEVETSTTIFNGTTEVSNSTAEQEKRYSRFYLATRTPSNIPIESMHEELVACVADALFPQEVLPGSFR